MKKKLFTITAVLVSLLFISCNNILGTKDNQDSKYNLQIKVTTGGDGFVRTISSWDESTFSSASISTKIYTKDGEEVDVVHFDVINEDGTEYVKYVISEGEYYVECIGSGVNIDSDFLYGRVDFEITDLSEVKEIVVPMGLKKTESGTGTIDKITIIRANIMSYYESSENQELFIVLEPQKEGQETIELPVNIFDISDYNTDPIEDVPSGYYDIYLKAQNAEQNFYFKWAFEEGTLLEMGDNQSINDVTLHPINVEKYLTRFATNDDTATGNGYFEDDPVNLKTLLTTLEDDDSWTGCKINMIEEHPVFDSFFNTIDLKGRKVSFYTEETLYMEDEDGPYELEKNSSYDYKEGIIELTGMWSIIEVSGKDFVPTIIAEQSYLNPTVFLIDGASINVIAEDLSSSKAEIEVLLSNPALYVKDAEGNGPLATVEYINCGDNRINIDFYINNGPNQEISYTIEDGLYKYYVEYLNNQTIKVDGFTVKPNFEIEVTDAEGNPIEGLDEDSLPEIHSENNITVTAKATNGSNPFAEGQKFKWYINETLLDEDGPSFTFKYGDDIVKNVDWRKNGMNFIKCEPIYEENSVNQDKKVFKFIYFVETV